MDMIRKILKISLIFLLFGLMTAEFGFSQNPTDLSNDLQRFDRLLANVRELVLSFNNIRGIQLVNEAEAHRNAAVDAFENDRPAEALANVKVAFAKLEAAIKITLDGPIRRLRSQVETLLQKADSEVLGRNHQESERVLREAKSNRDAAERSLAAQNVRKAVEHFRVAKTLAQRALDMVHSGHDNVDAERRKFEILRDRAHDQVEKSGNANAQRVFRQAMRMAQNAEDAWHNGKFASAKRLLNQSTMLLLRALDLASDDSSNSVRQADVALFQLRQSIENSESAVFDSKNSNAKQLVERAKRFSNEAELAAKEGRTYEAIWKVELGENLIQRALRLSQGGGRQSVSNKISDEIENAKIDISQLRSNLEPNSPSDVQGLVRMSEFAIGRAERAAASGFDRLALEAVLAAQRFLTRAEGILESPVSSSSQVSRETTLSKFNQLDTAISESEGNLVDGKETWNRQLISSAREIRNLAYESFEKGNYQAANEGVQVAFDLIRKSSRNAQRN